MTGFVWRTVPGRRPWWMNVPFAFCLMSYVYVPFDLCWNDVARDEDVWFGFLLRGWAAKLTDRSIVRSSRAAAYGFWKMRPWMWPWAAVCTAQISIGTKVWKRRDARGDQRNAFEHDLGGAEVAPAG